MNDFLDGSFAMSAIGLVWDNLRGGSNSGRRPTLCQNENTRRMDPGSRSLRSLLPDDVGEIEFEFSYVLKKLFAASFDARFLVAACCSRSISAFRSAMRSVSSSTDSSDRSCPISWVTFFLGLSSSSAAMRLLRARRSPWRLPAAAWLANQGRFQNC